MENLKMKDIIIRIINKNDIDEVSKTFMKTFNNSVWKTNWTKETSTETIQSYLDMPKALCIGAFYKEQCLGAMLCNIRPYSDHYSGYLYEMFIDPDYHGSSIATKLFENVSEELKKHNAKYLFFTTSKDIRAYYFYKKMGCIELNDGVMFLKEL